VGGNITLNNDTASSNLPILNINNTQGGGSNTVGLTMSPWTGRTGGAGTKVLAVDDADWGGYLSLRCATGASANTAVENLRICGGTGGANIPSSMAGYVYCGNLTALSTTDSSSSTTGALVCKGGAAIAKNLYVGGTTVLTSGVPTWSNITSSNFTANQTSFTAISGLSFSNSAMNGGSSTITLPGKGKWHVTGYVAADAVINIGSVNHIYIVLTLSGSQISHTLRTYNFSFGTGVWEFNTTIWSTVTNESVQVLYHKSNNDITNASINLQFTKAESY
jgi:hypothetical protein